MRGRGPGLARARALRVGPVVGLWIYRAGTWALGAASGALRRAGSPGGTWSAGWVGESAETARAAGSVWVHAASIGEVGAAAVWVGALRRQGIRPPLLLTTRTSAGLDRARRDLGADVAARIAPHDAPQVLGSFVAAAAPWRLDVIETELWPNLILEARRRSVAVAFVSASVSERSTRRLRLLGLAGHRLFGTGVYVLAQTGAHAERFCRLGVPGSRVRVVGDLKAEALPGDRRGGAPFARRPALVFGSARFGEEEVAVRAAEILERHRVEFGDERSRWAAERGVAEDIFAGRCRPVLIVAPRHRGGESRVADALRSRGFQVSVREESHRSRQDLESWIDELSRRSGPRAGVLATRGELVSAYGLAWATLVGGTFAPRGGHTVWEAAARGCPVLAGPHHDQVLAGIEALAARGAGVVLADRDRHLERVLAAWLRDQDLDRRGAAALQAFTASGGAAERALEALGSWGLNP